MSASLSCAPAGTAHSSTLASAAISSGSSACARTAQHARGQFGHGCRSGPAATTNVASPTLQLARVAGANRHRRRPHRSGSRPESARAPLRDGRSSRASVAGRSRLPCAERAARQAAEGVVVDVRRRSLAARPLRRADRRDGRGADAGQRPEAPGTELRKGPVRAHERDRDAARAASDSPRTSANAATAARTFSGSRRRRSETTLAIDEVGDLDRLACFTGDLAGPVCS